MTVDAAAWDGAYAEAEPPPWDIGRPQPAFVRLAESGALAGRVLDAGCGTGEHTLLAAEHGADALGVDLSARAIEAARRKAAERGVAARFEVRDIIETALPDASIDVVIDCGLFHSHGFADPELGGRYVATLRAVLAPGGMLHLMCFSEHQPGDWGPRRLRQQDLRDAFADGWTVERIDPEVFVTNPIAGTTSVSAWLATIRRD